jgi:hypothetical protein
VRNNERYSAFSPAVTPAVSRGVRSWGHFLVRYFSTAVLEYTRVLIVPNISYSNRGFAASESPRSNQVPVIDYVTVDDLYSVS